MIVPPQWIEQDRRKPLSPVPYSSHHNTCKCVLCGAFVLRKERIVDGKRNLCRPCGAKVVA